MSMRPRTLALLATVCLWAGTFTAIKALLDDGLSGQEVAVARYVVAAPGFLVLLWRAGWLREARWRDLVRIALAGVLSVTVYHVALNVGEQSTTSGVASMIVALAPVLTLCFALALRLERFSSWRLAGMALAFAGDAVAVLAGSAGGNGSSTAGPLIVLVASCSFALYNVIVKPLLARLDPVAVTAAAALAGTAALLPFGVAELPREATHLAGRDWALLLYLGIGATLLGYLCWTAGLQAFAPSRAASFLYAVPPLALLLGALLLGEPLTAWIVAGGALIVGGVAMAQRPLEPAPELPGGGTWPQPALPRTSRPAAVPERRD